MCYGILALAASLTIGAMIFLNPKINYACLETNNYGVEIVSVEKNKLKFQGNIVNSGIKFEKYEIKLENNTVFFKIYASLISNCDSNTQEIITENIGFNAPDIAPDFDIQYTIPDNVDTIYLCGKTKNDLKVVWKRE